MNEQPNHMNELHNSRKQIDKSQAATNQESQCHSSLVHLVDELRVKADGDTD